jgi:SNF family Na+-dependent transporter
MKGEKERWGSRFGVILAVTGSAVGLGNFLRFPGLAAQYEGGAFMIPYFISLFLIGLPLAWAEWAMGRYGGTRGFNSTPGIFRAICGGRLPAFLGVFGLIVPVVIYMYYVFIEAWCLGYAWNYLVGGLNLGGSREAYGSFFASYIGASADGALVQNPFNQTLAFTAICVVVNFLLIYRGINKGIEWFCLRAMPLLVVCAVLVLIRVLTLGAPDPAKPELNVWNGLGFMWNPHFGEKGLLESLSNSTMWLQAAGQIFFSLSVGFGVVITYASYLREKDDIALSSTTAVAGNEFCEVSLGGMITIPAAFVFLGAAGAVGGTFGLGFQTLPLVFEMMPLGRWVGFLFFFLLFLAAITSSLSMLQPAIAFLEEGLALNRKASVALLGFVTLVGNCLVIYFSGNTAAIDGMDFWVGTFCIYVLATIQTLIFGWVLGTKKGLEELERGAAIRIPRWFPFVIRYVSPLVLFTIMGFWLVQSFWKDLQKYWEPMGGKVAMIFVALCFGFFLILIQLAVSRWETLERGKEP